MLRGAEFENDSYRATRLGGHSQFGYIPLVVAEVRGDRVYHPLDQ